MKNSEFSVFCNINCKMQLKFFANTRGWLWHLEHTTIHVMYLIIKKLGNYYITLYW